jgi:molybdate transport system substrate-binding protein
MKIFCAGSLAPAMQALIAAYGGPAPELVRGPAGLLGQRIEAGERAEVFLSASPSAPRRLSRLASYAAPVLLCHNRLAIIARPGLAFDEAGMLDRLLDPGLTLVSSTPGADPGGDYAMALLAALERVRPGSEAVLRAKVRHPFGGPDNSAPVNGMSPAVAFLKRGGADLMIVYRTTARAACAAVAGASFIEVPSAWLPRTEATLTWLPSNPEAVAFADYLRGDRAAAIIADAGLEPAARG